MSALILILFGRCSPGAGSRRQAWRRLVSFVLFVLSLSLGRAPAGPAEPDARQDALSLDPRRRVLGRRRLPIRPLPGGHGPRRHGGRVPDPCLFGRLHGRRPVVTTRYFAYLNLFTFVMLILVLASNVVLMFVGWEGVGLCSYLLIGFWFENRGGRGRKKGLHRQPGRRRRLHRRNALPPDDGRSSFFARSARRRRRALPPRSPPSRPPPLRRGDGEIRPDPALCLAAGRHGGPRLPSAPSSTPRPHGDGRGLHGLPAHPAARLPVTASAVVAGGAVPRSSPRPWPWRRTTSSASSPIRRSRRSATCSRLRRRGLCRRHVPSRDPRLLQKPALPGRRERHPRPGRATRTCGRWAGSGTLPATSSPLSRRADRHFWRAVPLRVLLERRDPDPGLRRRPLLHLGAGSREGRPHRLLHVPALDRPFTAPSGAANARQSTNPPPS